MLTQMLFPQGRVRSMETNVFCCLLFFYFICWWRCFKTENYLYYLWTCWRSLQAAGDRPTASRTARHNESAPNEAATLGVGAPPCDQWRVWLVFGGGLMGGPRSAPARRGLMCRVEPSKSERRSHHHRRQVWKQIHRETDQTRLESNLLSLHIYKYK